MRTLYEEGPILRLVSDEPATVIRALVADGHGLVRAGVRRLLEDQEDVTVTGEAESGEEAVRLARRTRPDAADSSPVDLVRAVRVLASGDAVLSPSLTSQLIARWLDAS
jgi:chemotaxis response regulator CheB